MAKEHLLKDGSHYTTRCGLDSEYKEGMICHLKMNSDVNCTRCIGVYRKLNPITVSDAIEKVVD